MLRCPVCSTDLEVRNREGVQIDVCSSCRGIWLDRGELEQLLVRSARDREDDEQDERYYHRPEASRQPVPPPPKKRESFWDRVFDFD